LKPLAPEIPFSPVAFPPASQRPQLQLGEGRLAEVALAPSPPSTAVAAQAAGPSPSVGMAAAMASVAVTAVTAA